MLRIVLIGALSVLVAGAALFAAVAMSLPFSSPRRPGAAERSIEVRGQRLVYREQGQGALSMLLLHGFGGSLDDYRSVLDKLGCGRVIALDLPGFGASDRPEEPYSLEMESQYVLAFMDALRLPRVVLVGQSMGASLTAWTAAHHPDRIAAAALLAPSGFPGSLRHPFPRSVLYRPGLPNDVSRWVARTPLFRALFPSSLAAQALGITSSYNQAYAEALKRIKQPTVVLWSKGDPIVPFASSPQYLQRIPHAQLIPLDEKAGHGLSLALPEQVAQRLCEFRDEL